MSVWCQETPEEGIGYHVLGLQAVMSHLKWVLLLKPRSSSRATSVLNSWVFFLSLVMLFGEVLEALGGETYLKEVSYP